MSQPQPEQPQQSDASQPDRDNGKTVAIVSYITLIGWIVALIIHQNSHSTLGAFHLRQVLGLMLSALILGWIPYIGIIISIVLFVFWVMGLINAAQGEQKPLPWVGDFYQQVFSFIH